VAASVPQSTQDRESRKKLRQPFEASPQVAGLRVLLATQKALGKPGAVHVRNALPDVMEVLTVTKLAQFITIE
jgi:hypothetical protein